LATAIVVSFVGDVVRDAASALTLVASRLRLRSHVLPKVHPRSRPWSVCRRIVLRSEYGRYRTVARFGGKPVPGDKTEI